MQRLRPSQDVPRGPASPFSHKDVQFRQAFQVTVRRVLATRFVRAFLFGVTPLDPITFATVAVLLVTAALIASYLPAR